MDEFRCQRIEYGKKSWLISPNWVAESDAETYFEAQTPVLSPGMRIKIVEGAGKDEIFVVKKIVSPATMTLRRYTVFDRVHDWILQTWHELEKWVTENL